MKRATRNKGLLSSPWFAAVAAVGALWVNRGFLAEIFDLSMAGPVPDAVVDAGPGGESPGAAPGAAAARASFLPFGGGPRTDFEDPFTYDERALQRTVREVRDVEEDVVTPKPKLVLPELTMIMVAGDRSAAIVGNEIVRVGDRISVGVVEAVQADGIRVDAGEPYGSVFVPLRSRTRAASGSKREAQRDAKRDAQRDATPNSPDSPGAPEMAPRAGGK